MVPELNENALKVLRARYLMKDPEGNVVETPSEMFLRVARYVAQAEKSWGADKQVSDLADDFFQMLSNLEFLPNSPTLMNAGRDLGQLSACFVLPVNDSLESIFDAVKNTAMIHQSGGGTGFSFSRLRPRNDYVMSTSGVASGPVSFMEIFNTATDIIKQGGTRRGANMGVLRVDHPDIEEFIVAKRDLNRLGCFNLSVGITDAFMESVKRDREFLLVNPRTRSVMKSMPARALFDLLAKCAWEDGEPGVLFLDEINRHNPTPALGSIEATNPCGEQPLLPYESCTLGSINLTRMLKSSAGHPEIDWEKLSRTVRLAVRFLDDVIEVNRYPLGEIRSLAVANRKIGLGIMGFAHLLIELGISYNSPQGIGLAREVMAFIQEHSHSTSKELALGRGPFPNFPGSIHDREGSTPLRNATLTTIAPTGSLSLIAGCSSGIEPLYALSFTRIIPGDIGVKETDPAFERFARQEVVLKPGHMEHIRKTGHIPDDPGIPETIRRLFVTAENIPPAQHVAMQAAFQAYTDNAVSKTINFNSNVRPDEIKEAFLLAYKMKCKGVTVYRDGSRKGQTLSCGMMMPC